MLFRIVKLQIFVIIIPGAGGGLKKKSILQHDQLPSFLS
mgnify:CR=1 FL=1